MLFPEKCYKSGEKYHICWKFLGISGKIISYLGKTVVSPKKFFDPPKNGTLTEIFFGDGGGRGGGVREHKKNF
jgi:hypothetical protein